MDILAKYVNIFAKTKKDALLRGGLFVGFGLGMFFFGTEDKFDFINIFKLLIAIILFGTGFLLVVRGSR